MSKKNRSIFIFLCAMLLSLVAFTGEVSQQKLQIQDAWVRAMPPIATTTAAYITLTNNNNNNIKIISVSSSNFSQAHLHKTLVENGLSTMMQQESLIILAGDTINFESNGLHIMLMVAKEIYQSGDSVEITLHFEEGGVQLIEAVVK